jgi:prepilin-type N-terminal cleavage/methylation domain-containing protein
MAEKLKVNKYFVTLSVLFQRLNTRREQLFAGCSGFTLIELIVVVAILGVLVTMALPFFSGYIRTVKNNACAADLRVIDKAISAYII